MEQDLPIEHQLVQTAVLVDIKVEDTVVKPTVDNDDFRVRIVMHVDEEELETSAFALIFTLGALSFHDGRPRGFSGMHFDDDDDWTLPDMMKGLEYRRGGLHFYADYVRGRCLKTSIELAADGTLTLETVNRGQAATRWVSKLQGEKTIRLVEQ